MHRHVRLLLGFTACIAAQMYSATSHAQPQMKPGLWEYKMTMEMAGMPNMPGMPGMGGAPMTFTRCLTPEDTKTPGKAFEDAKAKSECEREEFKIQGNKVSFKVRCGGDHPGTGSGEFTVAEDHFEGTLKMKMEGGDMGGMEMTQKMSGKRIGECKK
jgi:hypothetical protein